MRSMYETDTHGFGRWCRYIPPGSSETAPSAEVACMKPARMWDGLKNGYCSREHFDADADRRNWIMGTITRRGSELLHD
jgi:hypothetical protein